jgi:hypothetical protein
MRLEGDYFIISRAEDENNGFLAWFKSFLVSSKLIK